MEHKITLVFGYTDKEGVTHKDVTFGKRPILKDLLALDMNPLTQLPTQYVQLVRRLMITKFGTLAMPVALPILLALDTVDDDKLAAEADQFLVGSREGRTTEFRKDEAKLGFGIEIDDMIYDTVRFGKRLTVNDYVEAERLRLGDGLAKTAHLAGCQVSEISSSEHGSKLEGQLSVEQLSGMDSEDFNILRFAAEFFRLEVPGTGATGKEPNGDDPPTGKTDGTDDRGSKKAADREV
jgi:hypothetical protein